MKVELEGITGGYDELTTLHDISLRIDKGKVLGVIGRNGMGKTTLIRTLAGLIEPDHGIMRLDGHDVTGLSSYERARRGLTTVVQGRGIFRNLSVRDHLIMGRVASTLFHLIL